MKSCRQSHANVYLDRQLDTAPPMLTGRPTEDRVQFAAAKFLVGTQKRKPESKAPCFSFTRLLTEPMEDDPNRLADAKALRDMILKVTDLYPGALILGATSRGTTVEEVEDFFLRAGFDAESVMFLSAGL